MRQAPVAATKREKGGQRAGHKSNIGAPKVCLRLAMAESAPVGSLVGFSGFEVQKIILSSESHTHTTQAFLQLLHGSGPDLLVVNGRCRRRSARLRLQVQEGHVLLHDVSGYMFSEQIRWVIGTGDLCEKKIAAPHPVLYP